MECEDPSRFPERAFRIPPFQPIELPEDLHSVYEEGPFRSCTVCDSDLLDGRLYEVQKVFRGSECVFEMGVCHECGESVAHEFSEESIEAMKGFLLCRFKPTTEPTHCHFCGFPRSMFKDYTLIGACRESSLILPRIIMCEKCGIALQECLSQKTRDVQGDFVQDCFPGVPADLDLSPTIGGLL